MSDEKPKRMSKAEFAGLLSVQPIQTALAKAHDEAERARASEKRLAEAAALAVSWMWDPDADQLEQFERIAAEYQWDTGYLRPGKDDPQGDSNEAENRVRWDKWRKQRSREVLLALRSALSEVES